MHKGNAFGKKKFSSNLLSIKGHLESECIVPVLLSPPWASGEGRAGFKTSALQLSALCLYLEPQKCLGQRGGNSLGLGTQTPAAAVADHSCQL